MLYYTLHLVVPYSLILMHYVDSYSTFGEWHVVLYLHVLNRFNHMCLAISAPVPYTEYLYEGQVLNVNTSGDPDDIFITWST